MRRLLLRNAMSTFGAGLLPAAAMLVTLPFIVRLLGTELYGVLTLVMAITGYFAVIDINVTAGSTKYLAEFHAKGDIESSHQVVVLGALFYGALGVLGALLIFIGAPTLVDWLMKSDAQHRAVAEQALRWAALGFLFGQMQSYFNSVPQALQRYDISARLEAFFGVAIPLGSVLVLVAGFGIIEVVILRVVCSGLHAGLLFVQVRRLLPGLRWTLPRRPVVSQIASFSAFSYLSRLAAMSHAHADKLIVGSLLGMTALAYYTVGAQIVGRVIGLTWRLSSVFFPAASAMQARAETAQLRQLYLEASRYITLLNGGAILLICLFGREILHYWIGPAFAEHAFYVMVFFAVAMFIDSLTSLPSLINDGLGHPRLTGTFAVSRAILTIVLTFILASNFSLEWVALGGTIAAAVLGFGFLVMVHGRTVPVSLSELFRVAYLRPFVLMLATAVLVLAVRPAGVMSLGATVGFASLVCGFGAALAVTFVLLPADRDRLLSLLRAKFSFFFRVAEEK